MLIKLKFSGWITVLCQQRLRPLHTVAESIHKQGSQLLLQRAVVGGNGFGIDSLTPIGVELAQRQVVYFGF
jgi:hypothetical protein